VSKGKKIKPSFASQVVASKGANEHKGGLKHHQDNPKMGWFRVGLLKEKKKRNQDHLQCQKHNSRNGF
jgi:hypothetical protein